MLKPLAVLVSVAAGLGVGTPLQALWQADLQVRNLSVAETHGNLTARVVVAAEYGEALATRVEVLLPVGVGLVATANGCAAGPSAPGVSALRARVVCSLGDLPPHATRELYVVTTMPPNGVPRSFGVMAVSDTPDPKPANNFAEKVIP